MPGFVLFKLCYLYQQKKIKFDFRKTLNQFWIRKHKEIGNKTAYDVCTLTKQENKFVGVLTSCQYNVISHSFQKVCCSSFLFPRYSNHFPLTFSITKFTYEVQKLLILFQKLLLLSMKSNVPVDEVKLFKIQG